MTPTWSSPFFNDERRWCDRIRALDPDVLDEIVSASSTANELIRRHLDSTGPFEMTRMRTRRNSLECWNANSPRPAGRARSHWRGVMVGEKAGTIMSRRLATTMMEVRICAGL